jgi:arylsulfatase A-like enzyme
VTGWNLSSIIESDKMKKRSAVILVVLAALVAAFVVEPCTAAEPGRKKAVVDAAKIKDIKAYCIDFNWEKPYGRPKLARLGVFGKTNPAAHLAWYKMLGVNVIQTFCVSTNGYAWYKNGFVPAQPGLKHDFLPEMVKLGHAEGMLVMGYFTIGSNPRWAKLRPDQNYTADEEGKISGGYHVVYTDDYLDFLSKSIGDAVRKTGIDGFMIDWLWQPTRKPTNGKWIECEKKLYKQLMGEPYPGDDALTVKQELAFGRKAIGRCWKAIRKAAKDANPKCVIWITVNHMDHPHVVDSDMYREADWLMNEKGDIESINRVKGMVGRNTHLITCMAAWTGVDATKVVPQALKASVGLYGFSDPRGKDAGRLAKLLARPVHGLKGDDRNIATLARAYHGVGMDTIRNEKGQWIKIPKPKKPTIDKTGPTKPNIVLITADDMAWTDYSMMGNIHVNTPHLAKLAGSGVLFKRGYVPTAWSRSSLMTLATGRYAHEHGITVDDLVSYKGAFKKAPQPVSTIGRFETLPKLLKARGYLSYQSGRWFEGRHTLAGFTHGTAERGDLSYDKPGIGPDGVKACTDFIDVAQKEAKPFFLWYAPALPAFNHNGRKSAGTKVAPERIVENQKFILAHDIDKYYLQFQKFGGRMDITKYYALIEWFDEHCGKLIAHLEKKGIRDNTLIVYLSANGWVSIRRRGDFAKRSKGSAYDGGVRSPVIYSWPAKIKPAVSKSLVSSADVVPTILAAAGAKSPKKALPGMNLLPVMEGKAKIDDRAVFGEAFARDIANIQNPEAVLLRRWVIHKQYKLILTYDRQGATAHKKIAKADGPQIYDLIKDPYEQKNLYGTLPKVYESLRSRLDKWYPIKERKVVE